MVDIDDSKEKGSGEDLTDAVVTEDDNSEEVKSDLNENTDDDSKEGTADSFTPKCDKISLNRHRNFSKTWNEKFASGFCLIKLWEKINKIF